MSDDVEAVLACLGDDAATLRDDNADCEIAANMDAAATLIGKLSVGLAAANEARQKAERERDEARENARVRSGEALDYYSAMLNLAHEFGAKDGDNMIEVIGNGIDALRAKVARLREVLERMVSLDDGDQPALWAFADAFDDARAALKDTQDG